MRRIVIVGATSGIGRALALLYAERTDAKIAILGRRVDLLRSIADICSDRFVYSFCDVADTALLPSVLDDVCNRLGGVDLMIVCAGTGDLNAELAFSVELSTLKTNVLGWTCVVDWAMKRFELQRFGHLVSISSVGGLRGSGIAPAYNGSKAFQINYMEGMRQRANRFGKGICVTDIRPGFVDTAMAKGDGLFWVAPVERASRYIYRSIERKKKVVYVTRRWRFVAFLLRCIPSAVYCRM